MITEYHLEIIRHQLIKGAFKPDWCAFNSNTYSLSEARGAKRRLEEMGYKVRIVKYKQAAPKRIGVVK
jgi:hypothetical protein